MFKKVDLTVDNNQRILERVMGGWIDDPNDRLDKAMADFQAHIMPDPKILRGLNVPNHTAIDGTLKDLRGIYPYVARHLTLYFTPTGNLSEEHIVSLRESLPVLVFLGHIIKTAELYKEQGETGTGEYQDKIRELTSIARQYAGKIGIGLLEHDSTGLDIMPLIERHATMTNLRIAVDSFKSFREAFDTDIVKPEHLTQIKQILKEDLIRTDLFQNKLPKMFKIKINERAKIEEYLHSPNITTAIECGERIRNLLDGHEATISTQDERQIQDAFQAAAGNIMKLSPLLNLLDLEVKSEKARQLGIQIPPEVATPGGAFGR